jgi:hypothetical protein
MRRLDQRRRIKRAANEDCVHRWRPGGALFRLADEKQNPAHEITDIERNRPYDTFGWGVVFSDQALGNLVGAGGEVM